MEKIRPALDAIKKLPGVIRRHKLQTAGLILVLIWCYPYYTGGNKIEWGDFSFFAQAYEGMRINILQYHQFPWWNPWMAGGVPLYANPQMGVFSIQTVLTLIFGAPLGLKLAVMIYTFLGYGSMQMLLRKYFKIDAAISILLSLLWIFCTFFVAHLPSHFTFVWYLMAPAFVYWALTIKTRKGGLIFGGAFTVMGLSQIHNPFFHISFVCACIFLVRLIVERANRLAILKAIGIAAAVFIVFCGHRLLLTVQNVKDFPHVVRDPAATFVTSALGPILPFSTAHPIAFLNYPFAPAAPYGFGEVTGTIGLSALMAVAFCILFSAYLIYTRRAQGWRTMRLPVTVFVVGLLFLSIGFGPLRSWAPYSLLKHLPVFSDMRVPSRWFLWFDLAMLSFIGLVVMRTPAKSFARMGVVVLLSIGVAELFVLNLGYQSTVTRWPSITAPKPAKSYTFEQTAHFGETFKLPDGGTLPRDDGHLPHFYREYEATTFNEGVLMANDSLVDLNTLPTPRCPWEKGCYLVLSGNAKVTSWSPGKIVLQRTGKGRIELNMNSSNYFKINGKRQLNSRVAEPYKRFYIDTPENEKTVTITVDPSPLTAVQKLLKL